MDVAGEDGRSSRWLATANEELAAIARADGRFDEAERLLLAALDLRREDAEVNASQLPALPPTNYALAESYAYSKNLARSEEAFRAALAVQVRTQGAEMFGVDLRFETALTHRGLARTLTDRARYDEAIHEQTAAIELCDVLISEQPRLAPTAVAGRPRNRISR